MKQLVCETMHSPDDGGYYSTLADRRTCKDVHTTDVFTEYSQAERAAQAWAKEHGYTVLASFAV